MDQQKGQPDHQLMGLLANPDSSRSVDSNAEAVFIIAGNWDPNTGGTEAEWKQYITCDPSSLDPPVALGMVNNVQMQADALKSGAKVTLHDWKHTSGYATGSILWTALEFDDTIANSLRSQTLDPQLASLPPQCPGTNASACTCPSGPNTTGCPTS